MVPSHRSDVGGTQKDVGDVLGINVWWAVNISSWLPNASSSVLGVWKPTEIGACCAVFSICLKAWISSLLFTYLFLIFLWLGVWFLCSRFYWIICVIPKPIVCLSSKLLNSSYSFSCHSANAEILNIPLCGAMIILWIPSLIQIICYTIIEYMHRIYVLYRIHVG